MINTFYCCISFLNLGQFITVQWPGATTGGLQEPCLSMTSQGESSNFFFISCMQVHDYIEHEASKFENFFMIIVYLL